MGNPKEMGGAATHTAVKKTPNFILGRTDYSSIRRSTQLWVLVQVSICEWRVYILPHIKSGHVFVFCLSRWAATCIWYSLMQGWAWLWQTAFSLLLSVPLYLCMCVWGTYHGLLLWRVRGDGSQTEQIEIVPIIYLLSAWGTDPWKAWRLLAICWSKPLEATPWGVLSRWSSEKLSFVIRVKARLSSPKWSEMRWTQLSQSRALSLTHA